MQEPSTEPTPTPTVAERITRWREHRKLRKIDLARAVDVAPATVTRWEQGGDTPTMENLHKIAAVLELGPDLERFFGALPEPEVDEHPEANGAS